MNHNATPEFWARYNRLPLSVRRLADKNFALLKADPHHPSLNFKRVDDYWSVRVGSGYRALGVDGDDGMVWVWIGSHAEYDQILAGR